MPDIFRIVGNEARGPELRLPLDSDELALVQAADGCSAELLLETVATPRKPREYFERVLARLEARGILRWALPVTIAHEPERRWLTIGPSDDLTALRALRDDAARSAGNHAALGAALLALEQEFQARTGSAPRRSAGRSHAGRGLVYEECRRATTLDLGQACIGQYRSGLVRVHDPSALVTFAIASECARSLREEFRICGRRRVPLHEFWRKTAPVFDHETPERGRTRGEYPARALARTLEIRPRPLGREYLDVETAEAFVAREFEAPCPGWPGARHHSVDLMWAAPTPDALLEGRGIPLLAELHPGVTPFTTLSTLAHCPVFEELCAEWREGLSGTQISPIPWEDFARSTQDARFARHHYHLDIGTSYASERNPEQVLRAADFDVLEHGGALCAVHVKNQLIFDLMQVFERRIKLRAAVAFSLSDSGRSGPRRYLGPLIVERAHWLVEKLPFMGSQAGATRLASVAEWRAQLGLPERIFVRSPLEVKPVYVDLTSGPSVELLVNLARQAPRLALSEMLPRPEDLWLRDAAGQTFTSELRFIAVDPRPFDGSQVWRGGS